MNTFGLLVLSICVISVECDHFLGASFSWAPLSNGSVQVNYRISLTYMNYCSSNTTAVRSFPESFCPSYGGTCHTLYYNCTDYSEEENWSGRRYTLLIDPIEEKKFNLTFSDYRWLYYGGWSLLTTVDLTPRDGSGWINSSPTVDYPPVVNLLYGCNHTISFPIRDVDGDIVKCRWATGSIECGSVCEVRNNALPGAQLNEDDCTITFEATSRIGLYPLAIQVEDFANSYTSVRLSSIPLQFMVNIYNITSASCAPELRFVTPTPASGECFALNVGEDFTVNITVTGTSSLTSLVTTSAVGMLRSAVISWQNGVLYYMSVTVDWTPTPIDDGQDHVLCFYARDINGRYSETRCITLPVGDCCLGFFRTINDICLECEEFQYGVNCSSDCTCDRTNSVSCNKVNGICECHEGWTGDNCTVNINECESSDICSNKSNSNCVDMMGTYDCQCNVGYVSEGDACLVDIGSHCDTSDICRGGALCIESTCSCRTGMYNSNADICDTMELYPFGQDSGDHVVENNDDKCVSLVQFRPGIPIFDDEHKNIYVCSNGVVSLGTPYLNAVPPRAISDYKDAVIFAPFFADSNGGNINYRTYDIQNNPDKLNQIEVKHVESFISNMTSTIFNTTFILFTTWNQVRPAQDIFQQTSETTFQLVLATDSSNTYVLYIYGHGMMNWSYLSKTVSRPDIWIGYTVKQMFSFSNIYSFKADVIKMDILSNTKGISGVLLNRLTHATPSLPSNAAKCLKWYNQNKHLKPTVQAISDKMPLCPCDVVGLKNNPWFNIEDMSSSEYICAEMLRPTHQHFGKTCCYGALGQILNDYNSTGKLLLYRPEFAEQHLVNDIEAFNSCCSSDETCSLFYELHPTGDCYGSAPFDVGALFGDPHFITLDGMNFTFNGFGEYSLLNLNYTDKVSDQHVEFKLQARTNRAVKENGSLSYATRFVAFAARDHTNASFQIELNNAEDGYAIYANGADLSLQYRTRSHSSLRKFVYISKDRNIELYKHKSENTIVVLFPFSDISLNITIGVKMLSLSLVVDEKYKHITTGMLGNFDGNPNNDFITPDGHTLSHDMTEEEIFDYGQSWGTQPSNSVFYYPMGKNHTDYNFREYRPKFLENENNTDVVAEAYNKCGALGNTQCVFDYVFTEDINVALDTRNIERIVEDIKITNNQTVPKVSVCDMVFVNIGEDAVCKLNISDTASVDVNVSRTSSNGRVIYDHNLGKVRFSVDDDQPDVILVSLANDFNRRAEAHISVAVCTGCSQHGKCIDTIRDDDRQTNYFKYQTCVCQPQYEGVDCENVFDGCRGNPCSHLRKCTTLTAKQQIAMNVSYVCESCPEGYNSVDDKCKDIDECANGDNTCEQTCLNNPGSYECSCTTGYRKSLSNDSICLDINECDEEVHNCSHVCTNFDGGYNCSCLNRYVFGNTTGQCILDGDVDNVCEQFGLNCSDTSGCTFDDDDSATCFCETGLALSDNGTSCIDVDECEQNICSQNCINTPGSFSCECYAGYKLVQGECKECEFPFWGPNCQNKCSCSLTTTIECHPVFGCQCSPGWKGMSCDQDIDECDKFPCPSILQKCLNSPGDYRCDCIDGYEYNKDEKICKDIDECSRPDLNKCSQTCTNVNGGYFCGCVDGYELYDDHLCRDIDDCEFGTNECEQLCASGDFISGSYNCYCYYGYFINDDRRTCTKDPKVRDTCEEIGFNCTHYCKPEVNPKNSKCRCRQGYKLANDQQTCIDINECLDSSLNKCDQKAECSNTEGSYECTCPIGSVLMNRRRCQDCDAYHYGINCEKECNCVYGTCNTITGCQCVNGWGGDDCNIDTDECAKNPCQNVANMECRNTQGSFSCKCRTGYFNETSETCSDIDECLDNSPPRCDQKCINTPGSFYCKCEFGFKYTNGRCEDLDECSDISKCDHICTNTIGSYRCSCQQGFKLNTTNRRSCNPITTCSANATMDCEQKNASCAIVDGNSKCICKVGYEQETDSDMCIDIKECSLKPKLCQDHECVELEGNFECQCLPGFHLLEDSVSCQECNQGTYGANCNETCTCMTESTNFCDTTNGTCYCKNGWTGDNCEEDVLECDKDDDLCDSNSVCVDIPGTFVCNCNQGYFKTGTGQCKVCNAFYFGEECSTECSCDQENTEMCNNVNGECTCSKGWSGANCTDNIDECVNTTICLHKANSSCIDTNGSYVCTCNDGYQPQGNRCLEIDECFEGTVNCTQECVNEPGSYMCQCFAGFEGNWNDCEVCNNNTFGFNCSETCPCNITNSVDRNQTCNPTNGTCVCLDNWKGVRCNEDVNECANNKDNCHESNNTGCLNTVGGYLCVCLKGFVRNITTDQCESEILENVTLPNGWVAVSYSISINVSLPPNFDLTLAPSYDIVEQNVITALEYFIREYTDGDIKIIIIEIRYGSIEVDYLVSYDSKNSDIGDQLAYAAVDLAAGKDIVYDGQTVLVRSTEFNSGTDPCVIYTSVIGCVPPNVCVIIDGLPACRYEIKDGNHGLIIYLSVFLSLAIVLVVLLVLCCLLLRKQIEKKKLLKKEQMTKQKLTLPGVPDNDSRLINEDDRQWKTVTDLDDAQITTKLVILKPMVKDDDQRRDYREPGDGDNHRGHIEQRNGGHRRSYSEPANEEHIHVHRDQGQHDYRRLPSALQRAIQTYEFGRTGSFHEAEDAMRQQGQHSFDPEDVQLRRESPQRSLLRRSFSYHERIVEPVRRNEPGRHSYHERDWY